MANPLDSSSSTPSPVRERIPAFALIGRVDDAVYAAERVIVTFALLLMSGTMCLYIFETFLRTQLSAWTRATAGSGSFGELWPAAAFGVAMLALYRAAAAKTPGLEAHSSLQWIVSSVGVVLTAVFGLAVLHLDSSTVCIGISVVLGAALIVAQLDAPAPLGTSGLGGLALFRLAVAIVTVVGGIALSLRLPNGYSWAQKLALFLLLWVAFIGASMATHDGRHLSIDAARKAVPEKYLPWFNALSWTLAALFTAAFCYLAFVYFRRRLVEDPTPGEIPDWIKVLSIPVSLALVTSRFLLQAVEAAVTGAMGLHLNDEGDAA